MKLGTVYVPSCIRGYGIEFADRSHCDVYTCQPISHVYIYIYLAGAYLLIILIDTFPLSSIYVIGIIRTPIT